MLNFYTSKSEADKALDHYENYILRCEYVIFLAVVEKTINKKNGFIIMIGISSEGKKIIKFDEDLSENQIVNGDFKDNTIPKYFPLLTNRSKVSNDSRKGVRSSKAISDKKEFLKHEVKWLQVSGSQSKRNAEILTYNNSSGFMVRNEKVPGLPTTLGGLFRLENFPHDLFGITNHHLFDNFDATLGDSVLDKDYEEIGNLFWKADDFEKESAILKMNCHFINKYLLGEVVKPLEIDKPCLGEVVYHNGRISGRQSRGLNSKIISLNATVRIHKQIDPEKWEIYKNQLLIEDNTEFGDSGSLVKSLDDKIVGLNFAKTSVKKIVEKNEPNIDITYSVANNITKIFNYDFPYDQEVFHKKSELNKSTIVTKLVERFSISKKI